MPCYQVNTISVDVNAADRDLLFKAMDALGYKSVVLSNGSIAVSTVDGTIVIGSDRAELPEEALGHLNAIKRGYSRQVVSALAKKYHLTETEREEDHVVLRGY